MSDWNPELYRRFAEQRKRPFLDLIDMLPPKIGGSWIDLGCGDGRLTRVAADLLGGGDVVGVDSSAEMIRAAHEGGDGRFVWRNEDIASVLDAGGSYELVLSNAALHFLDGHDTVMPGVLNLVAPGGWVAIHMPYNQAARTHMLADAAAASDELAEAFGGFRKVWPQARPEAYARMLKAAGFDLALVQLRTYRHAVEGAGAIVDWMRGAGLRPWLAALDEAHHEAFLQKYERLLAHAYPPYDGEKRLLDYTRLFLVARRPGA
jgi:trans-aconitate 2-methyltransferase